MAADTAEGLLAEIESTKEQVQAAEVRNQELCVLTREAEKRQRLRRELDVQRTILANRQRLNALESLYRHEVDRDEDGPHCLTAGPRSQAVASKEHPQDASGGERTNCAHKVAKGEYVWQIDSFSWSRLRLRQSGLFCVVSKLFKVGGYEFQFVYQPDGGIVNCTLSQRGSLAIIFWGSDPIVLRYRIYIKARSGEFVQWGELREELHDVDDGPPTAYGPDVHEAEKRPCVSWHLWSDTPAAATVNVGRQGHVDGKVRAGSPPSGNVRDTASAHECGGTRVNPASGHTSVVGERNRQ